MASLAAVDDGGRRPDPDESGAFEWNGAQAWLSGVDRQTVDLIARTAGVMPRSSVATTPTMARPARSLRHYRHRCSTCIVP